MSTAEAAAQKIQKRYRGRRERARHRAATQDHYMVRIYITTNKTGKRKIEFKPSMLSNPVPSDMEGPANIYFLLKRQVSDTPYTKQTNKEKKVELNALQKNIQHLLEEIFASGHQIRLPNPLYPDNQKRDLIFTIANYKWKHYGHHPGFGNYKFVIDIDSNNNLIVNIAVALEGNFVKGAHSISGHIPPSATPPSTFGARITRACHAHLRAVRDLVHSYYESKKFEKMVMRGEDEERQFHSRGRTTWKGGRRTRHKRRVRDRGRSRHRRRRTQRHRTRRHGKRGATTPQTRRRR